VTRAFAPGKDAVSGSRTDAYRLAWCWVFDLDAGETFTAAEIYEAVLKQVAKHAIGDEQLSRQTVRRALACAVKAVLCERTPGVTKDGRPCFVWRRLAWPETVTLKWLRSKGAPALLARNILSALESGDYLSGEFRRAPD
jgi:hypothetical protein